MRGIIPGDVAHSIAARSGALDQILAIFAPRRARRKGDVAETHFITNTFSDDLFHYYLEEPAPVKAEDKLKPEASPELGKALLG